MAFPALGNSSFTNFFVLESLLSLCGNLGSFEVTEEYGEVHELRAACGELC